jgi:hypothetical protein
MDGRHVKYKSRVVTRPSVDLRRARFERAEGAQDETRADRASNRNGASRRGALSTRVNPVDLIAERDPEVEQLAAPAAPGLESRSSKRRPGVDPSFIAGAESHRSESPVTHRDYEAFSARPG